MDPLQRDRRLAALKRQVQRLERRLERLKAAGGRFTWLRLGAFSLWVAAGVYSLNFLPPIWAVLGMLGGLAVFLVVVYAHRQLDRWVARFEILRSHTASQVARMQVEWEGIPPPLTVFEGWRSGMAVDLDLTGPRSLHHLSDLSLSVQGSRLLADWLTQQTPDQAEVAGRQAVVRELAPMVRFRNRLLVDFRLISPGPLKGERLLGWLAVEFPAWRLKWLVATSAAMITLNAVLLVLYSTGRLPAFWLLTVALYLAFYFHYAAQLNDFLHAVVELDAELDPFRAVLKHLENEPFRGKVNLAELCAPFRDPQHPPSRQIRQLKLVTAAIGLRSNPFIGLFLNLILPWDFTFAILAERLRKRAAIAIPIWLETLTRLEALISLANFAELNPDYALPEIVVSAEPVFAAEGLGHPLIPAGKRISNAAAVPALGEVILVTGSNMSGKSTFVKTIGVNLCLAYAGGPVCASRLVTRPFRLHTCIRITDSIADGFSYFYAEVKCLRSLLEELRMDNPHPVLYLIDEIFRGTNNRERYLGSRAYIRALIGARGVGWIATHDLELARLADEHAEVRNVHFRDHVEDGRLVFDYRLRSGPSPTTNALKIMRLEGLPVDE